MSKLDGKTYTLEAAYEMAENQRMFSTAPDSTTVKTQTADVDRTPGRLGGTVYNGKVYPEPVTTLRDDPAFSELAAETREGMKSPNYKSFRAKLNQKIIEVLESDVSHPLKEILSIEETADGKHLKWKSGPFAGQKLEYAHLLGQKVNAIAGGSPTNDVDLDNLSPVGDKFHRKRIKAEQAGVENYGHPEESATNYGKKLTPEAKAAIQNHDKPTAVQQSGPNKVGGAARAAASVANKAFIVIDIIQWGKELIEVLTGTSDGELSPLSTPGNPAITDPKKYQTKHLKEYGINIEGMSEGDSIFIEGKAFIMHNGVLKPGA